MIFLNVDLAALVEFRNNLESGTKQALKDAARDLSLQAHAHILEEVQSKLHSTREKYIAALDFKQVSDDTWVISLDESAMWIEEGLEEHEMLQDMLSSPKAKTAKDGSRYLVVPFQHNKGPTKQTRAEQDLNQTIQAELKRRKIPYGKLETGSDGKPKTGLLHSFDIMKAPTKTHEGPGQGHGPIGAVRQGNTGIPFLQGVRVYQKEIKNQAGKKQIVKNIMTFRVASSKQVGSGKWVHPGLKAKKFLDETAEWCLGQWEQRIVPDLLRRLDQVL